MSATQIEVVSSKFAYLPVGAVLDVVKETKVHYLAVLNGHWFKVNKVTGFCPSSFKSWYSHSERPLFKAVESWQPVEDQDAWKAQDRAIINANRK